MADSLLEQPVNVLKVAIRHSSMARRHAELPNVSHFRFRSVSPFSLDSSETGWKGKRGNTSASTSVWVAISSRRVHSLSAFVSISFNRTSMKTRVQDWHFVDYQRAQAIPSP